MTVPTDALCLLARSRVAVFDVSRIVNVRRPTVQLAGALKIIAVSAVLKKIALKVNTAKGKKAA